MRTTLASILLAISAPSAACQLSRVVELPVTMAGLRPLIPVTINGQKAMLLADTGAFYSLLTVPGAKRLGLPVSSSRLPPGFVISGVAGTASTGLTKVKAFGLGPAIIPQVDFLVAGGDIGGEAVGVLGQNVLGAFDVEIDLANGAIRLFRPKGCGKTGLAYWAGDKPLSIIRIERSDERLTRSPEGEVTVNGVRLKAVFDTGAATSIMTVEAARRAGVRTDSPGVVYAGGVGGIGRRSADSWIGPFKSFEIGGIKVNNTKLRFGGIQLGGTDMLIGDDFFLSTRVYFAYSQNLMYFTYNGGRMFDLRTDGTPPPARAVAAAAAGPEPKTADEFARRGAALMARGDLPPALADLDRAVALDAASAEYRYRRALLHLRADRRTAARADVNAAIERDPRYAEALILRATLIWNRGKGDKAAARADLAAAAGAVPDTSGLTIDLGGAYEALDEHRDAVAQYSRWMANHREDAGYPTALNNRCWARAQGGFELDQALADCNAAVRLTRRSPDVLDSRGLVYLRMGDYARALADYDAVLAQNPKVSWSLLGRGLARLKTGRTAEGEADLAAAARIDPELPAQAERLGIKR